jgi:hypothetical protein
MKKIKTNEVAIKMSDAEFKHLEMMAKNRYGDNTHENREKVIGDGVDWLTKQWSEGNYSLYDWFWSTLAFYGLFHKIKSIGWNKLLIKQYLSLEGKK